MSDTKLKPCPFCGCNLHKHHRYYHHEINGCIFDDYEFFEEDFEKWNTRKPIDRIVEQIEKQINGQTRLFNEEKMRGDINEAKIHKYAEECYKYVLEMIKESVDNE